VDRWVVYTQPPPLTDEEIESFLKQAKVARFCSLNEDGTIHAVPVWYRYEDGRIMVATPAASRKARNVRRNRNVTLLIDVSEGGVWPKGVIICGKAESRRMPDLLVGEAVSLCEKYMPRDRAEGYARGLLNLTRWVKIVVKPERISSFDYTRDEAYKTAVGE